jgi:hypothetical protein
VPRFFGCGRIVAQVPDHLDHFFDLVPAPFGQGLCARVNVEIVFQPNPDVPAKHGTGHGHRVAERAGPNALPGRAGSDGMYKAIERVQIKADTAYNAKDD